VRKKPTFELEKELCARGFKTIAGVDEVGRGCLAGPVVAAAVILPMNHGIEGLNDSKKLTPKKREALYEIIYKKAVAIGIGSMQPDEIDKINILQASIEAMKKAIIALNPQPAHLLVDGNLPPLGDWPQQSVVQGDSKSESIAAASIIAKVFRDQMMHDFGDKFPQYGLASNKGYPTETHLNALKEYGVTEIHRKTFRGVRELLG
jgi:ribonuclease HII